jgi:hypothetical protein
MDSNKQPLPPDEQYALAEAMVIIVFNMGASALDSNKKEREKIVKRATLQLKMLNYGAPSLIHR